MKPSVTYLSYLIIVLLSSVPFVPVRANPHDFDTLTTLLKELREIRQAKHKLHSQWVEEKSQLELMGKLNSEKLRAMEDGKQKSEGLLAELRKNLADHLEQNRMINESAGKLRDWIDSHCKSLLEDVTQYNILMDKDFESHIHNLLKKDQTTTDKVVLYLNHMLDTASSGIRATVASRVVEIDDEKYAGDVLTLGGFLEYFLPAGSQFCGVRGAGTENKSWEKLEEKYAHFVKAAIKVVNNEVPPTLITVPVPMIYVNETENLPVND